MSKVGEALLIEGTVARVELVLEGGQQTTVTLHNCDHQLVFPGIFVVNVSDHLRAICGQDAEGTYVGLDVILVSNGQRFTAKDRIEQARRAGVPSIYDTPDDISCRSVLGRMAVAPCLTWCTMPWQRSSFFASLASRQRKLLCRKDKASDAIRDTLNCERHEQRHAREAGSEQTAGRWKHGYSCGMCTHFRRLDDLSWSRQGSAEP